MGLYEKAIAEYQLSLDTEPLFPGAYHGIGGSYLQLQRFEDAAKYYLDAVHPIPYTRKLNMVWDALISF